ncbi:hypothetical protein HJC23_009481 [Cyclotella cryptica]|uniref:4-hydroxyphenylpyruvate dioxygenase n=1 Tax=Cyclotella cryptica TaxID=29204 RepID=A0ABD3P862_9STRA
MNTYSSHGPDIVKHMIVGFGLRVTGCYPYPDDSSTKSSSKTVLLTSSDLNGIQIVVSSGSRNHVNRDKEVASEKYPHFEADQYPFNILTLHVHCTLNKPSLSSYNPICLADNIDRFFRVHFNRQGLAVLAFQVGPGCLSNIVKRYSSFHPQLIVQRYMNGPILYENEATVFEVFAYYKGDKDTSYADEGTVLHFLEPVGVALKRKECKLPGIVSVPAKFHPVYHSAYFDHSVSKVFSRTRFLTTLEETLYFTSKVDFNSGVVATGEAQIESTVTGNTLTALTLEMDLALKDQSQIYLAINNTLTNVGHVDEFLKGNGQGVQHIASRVKDIVAFVQQANNRRDIFGEFHSDVEEMILISSKCARSIIDICTAKGILHFAVYLDVSQEEVRLILDTYIPEMQSKEYRENESHILHTIMISRYVNLFYLLRDHLSEDTYLAIVRNQILVDVQGDDLLFQIFTSNILQQSCGEEAPFHKFIQRVCLECTASGGCLKQVRPGCEVTKAMLEASNAKTCGDQLQHDFFQHKVNMFTQQLNESNPIQTEISDAMMKEGIA